jgi:peroxiredoxin
MFRMFRSVRWLTPLSLVLVLAPAAVRADDAPEALALGTAAPMTDQQMRNVDGKQVTIADVKGKHGTLVVFTCNACPYARAWQTRIAALGNAALQRGIGVIAINANDPNVNGDDSFDGMVARAKQLGLKFPYVVDATSNIARAYGATRTPEAFLFDAEGKLVYHGTIDDNAHDASAVKQRYLRNAVDAVVAGKTVPVAETKAIGCSIKFRSSETSGS